MALEVQIKLLADRARKHPERFKTAESTFRGLVEPLLQELGYDVFDPAVLEALPHAEGEGADEGRWLVRDEDGAPWLLVACRALGQKASKDSEAAFTRALKESRAALGLRTDGGSYRVTADRGGRQVASWTQETAGARELEALRCLEAFRRDADGFFKALNGPSTATPRLRWERIEVKNFGAHRETAIDLGRLTIIVGPNGTGKTTLLRAIQTVVDAGASGGDGNPARYFPGQRTLELGRRGERWTLTSHYRNQNGSFGYVRCVPQPNNSTVALEGNTIRGFQSARYLLLRSEALEQMAEASASQTTIDSRGAGLASAMTNLILYGPETVERIHAAMRAVFPELRELRIKPRGDAHKVLVFDFKDVLDVPASRVSEGMLIILGVLVAVLAEPRSNMILLDNLEQGLHPKAQYDLIGQLRVLLEQLPELQIVATTHSPYLVDALKPEEVWVLVRNRAGDIEAHCLKDHPRRDMLEYLSTGEFWSQEGDVWEGETR